MNKNSKKIITLDHDSVVVTIGAMGTGKSTFCSKQFKPSDLISSDLIRERLVGDFESQQANDAVFEILYAELEIRMKHNIFTVVDSTGSRSLLNKVAELAKQYNKKVYALVFPHLSEDELTPERMKHRMRYIGVYHNQVKRINETDLPTSFTPIVVPKENRNQFRIAFDYDFGDYEISNDSSYMIIPDIHGCADVYERALQKAYKAGHKVIQLGDLTDRGVQNQRVCDLTFSGIDRGDIVTVRANHDDKLCRYFRKWINSTPAEQNRIVLNIGDVPDFGMRIGHGMSTTLLEFYSLSYGERRRWAEEFIRYYETTSPILALERPEAYHFFGHANVDVRLLQGMPENKSTLAKCIYETAKTIEDVVKDFQGIADRSGKHVFVHLGHDFQGIIPVKYHMDDVTMIKHDVGIGKYPWGIDDEDPEFIIV